MRHRRSTCTWCATSKRPAGWASRAPRSRPPPWPTRSSQRPASESGSCPSRRTNSARPDEVATAGAVRHAPRPPPPPPPSPAASGRAAAGLRRALTPAQLARLAPHGRRRRVAPGEVLVQAGESAPRLFIVLTGRIDVARPAATEEIVVSFGPGMFTGEATMLSGRRGLAQIQAGADGEAIEVRRDDLMTLIQTDTELSTTFMRAFLPRRGGVDC